MIACYHAVCYGTLCSQGPNALLHAPPPQLAFMLSLARMHIHTQDTVAWACHMLAAPPFHLLRPHCLLESLLGHSPRFRIPRTNERVPCRWSNYSIWAHVQDQRPAQAYKQQQNGSFWLQCWRR